MRIFEIYAALWSMLSIIESIVFQCIKYYYYTIGCASLFDVIALGGVIIFVYGLMWGVITKINNIDIKACLLTFQLVFTGLYILHESQINNECTNQTAILIFLIQFSSLILFFFVTIIGIYLISRSTRQEEYSIV
jgi:hypothetical protein